MKKLLEKISWVTRKWQYKFGLFDLLLHDHSGSWGFKLITLDINLRDYSLLAFKFRLPNKTTINTFVVDDWDILFLHNYLWKQYDNLSDSKLWGTRLNWWNKTKLHFLNKLFN
jgi:hypothetical protein